MDPHLTIPHAAFTVPCGATAFGDGPEFSNWEIAPGGNCERLMMDSGVVTDSTTFSMSEPDLDWAETA